MMSVRVEYLATSQTHKDALMGNIHYIGLAVDMKTIAYC